MKIKEINKDIPEGYELIVGCYADEKDVSKMAVMLGLNKQTNKPIGYIISCFKN